MEDLGVERIFARPIKLFQLSDWTWDWTWGSPEAPFTLMVAAEVSTQDEINEIVIRRFAREAVAAGCGYVCAWGPGCELVHDLFDAEALAVNRFVMSTWHDGEALHKVLYQSLVAFPEEVASEADSPVILAVEAPWIAEVTRWSLTRTNWRDSGSRTNNVAWASVR